MWEFSNSMSNRKAKLKPFLWCSPSCFKLSSFLFSCLPEILSRQFLVGGKASVICSNSWDHYTITPLLGWQKLACAPTDHYLELHLLSYPCSAHFHNLLWQNDVKQGAFPWCRLMFHTAMPGIFVNGLWLEIAERQCCIQVMHFSCSCLQ